MKDIIFSTGVKTSFRDFLKKKIDKKIIKSLERGSIKFNAERGEKIAVFANEHIGLHINQYGCYDRLNLELLFTFLNPLAGCFKDALALDIGANIGNHSLFFSRYFGSVCAFEPNQRTFDLLSFNSKSVDNVTPFKFGLGDVEGVFALNENPNNMGSSSIKYSDFSQSRRVDISVKRLDDIELPAAEINFVKIDVEGFESNVIKGGLGVLKKSQPLIIFEQHASEFENGSTEAIDLLKSLGYRFCWQMPESRQKGWLSRQIGTIGSVLLGKPLQYVFKTGDTIPCGKYGMLIAVPARFQARLGFEANSPAAQSAA